MRLTFIYDTQEDWGGNITEIRIDDGARMEILESVFLEIYDRVLQKGSFKAKELMKFKCFSDLKCNPDAIFRKVQTESEFVYAFVYVYET